MNKNTDIIPHGMYCYDDKGICPYWSIKEDLPEQENGYCSFLEKSDYEINRIEQDIEVTQFKNGSAIKTIEKFGPSNPSFFGLLWDQVKETDCPKQ